MIQINMEMPKRCKGCPFTDWAIDRKALSCTILHEPIAKYERIGNTGREYELVYLYGTDEKRRLDCPLSEVKDGRAVRAIERAEREEKERLKGLMREIKAEERRRG